MCGQVLETPVEDLSLYGTGKKLFKNSAVKLNKGNLPLKN
jgi:hypothetical protein